MPRRVVVESMSLSNPRVKRSVVEFDYEDDRFYQGVREILAHLPETKDITILTLKGHLIVEQLLIQMVESAAINATPLKALNRLQFSTRVIFAESLVNLSSRRPGGIWPLVRMVGKIRNDVAHQLQPKTLNEEIEKFIGLYVRFFGARVKSPIHPANRNKVTSDNYLIPQNVRNGPLSERYRNALAGTCQGLAGVLAVIRANAKVARAAIDKSRTESRTTRIRKRRANAP